MTRPNRMTMALSGIVLWASSAVAQSDEVPHPVGPDTTSAAWRMPPIPITMPMLPALRGTTPKVEPYLPYPDLDPATLPEAVFRQVVPLDDGDTLHLEAMTVRRSLKGRDLVMYGFNGQYPGPLIRVPQNATVTIVFRNSIDQPTTVHWHGVRLDNRFDGVPGVTQDPVQPRETFVYQVRFPDAGIYWYHPHLREDIQQDLGLYGNMLVDSPDEAYWAPVDREEVVMLDDILIDEKGLFPFGASTASHALMGRFGNVFLLNGEPEYRTTVRNGDVVRFYLTDVSNTRTFNLVFGDAPIKLVGADIFRFEKEVRVPSVVIAPAQRYVVEVRFDKPGTVALTNNIQAVDHFWGRFYPRTDTLGLIEVVDGPGPPSLADFDALRRNDEVVADIDRFRGQFGRPPDRELELTTRIGDLNAAMVAIMSLDTLYFPPVEWNDAMPMMNYLSSGEDVEWVLRDPRTGRENMEIDDWRFRVGDVVKIRILNSARSFHPMQHPIHLHGQRFLVVSQDGVPRENLAWKDTIVIPVGSTVDILLEVTNPGRWMLHCHIAEHLEAGMMMAFDAVE